MRTLLTTLCLLLSFFWSAPAWSEIKQPSGDKEAIISVIQAQLDAFQQDNGPLAFSYAAPNIKRMFQSPERFMDMVVQGYQPVYRPRSVEFGQLVEHHGAVVQVVQVVGPDGIPYNAYYTMERQADGTWKINGCMLERLPGFNA